MAVSELKLKVAEAIQDDVNKGIVRVDSGYMKQIGIRSGDVVEISGGRKTVAIADRAYPGDIGLNIIRMDGLIRRNSKTGIGEVVNVKKANVKEAKKITIAPAREGILIRANPVIFKQGLLGRAVVKGDIVSLGGTRTRRSTMTQSPFFDDIFNVMNEEALMGFGLGDLKFMIVDSSPVKEAVIITDSTEVIFNPEAVPEVKEERVPDVSYEDIGGLDDELKKVREMVELPLKHPEIFGRLGIEPPKGVLLHGPPGTGKTLLAKAVANETQSNFILINGPEIMSKYYGQSLIPEEKVLVVIDGKFKRMPIGDLVERRPKNAQAVCFDRDGKISVKGITSYIKHLNHSKIVEIKTESGRNIKVTDDHSVFTIGKSGIESVKTSDLIEGKSFIAIPKKLPEFDLPESIESIRLIELLKDNDCGITIKNIQPLINQAISVLGRQKVSELLECKERYVYDITSKNVGIPVAKFVRLMNGANILYDENCLQLSTKGKSTPAIMHITDELSLFFGLWMAEGSYTNKNEVRISIHEDELKYYEQLTTRLFGNITIYKKLNSKGVDIYICSGIIGKIMKVLGFNSGARLKKVPDFVYSLDNQKIASFLRGYISGDGSLNNTTPAPMIEIDTESITLADDISYLLLRLGIVTKIYLRKNRPQKRLCFSDFENLENFKNIGFVNPEKNKIIFDYTQTKTFSRRDQLPITGIVQDAMNDSNLDFHVWKNSDSIGKNILMKIENRVVQSLLHSDIKWDRVMSIKECPDNPEFVYDISVPGCENFIAGFGGIFAHNSEENLRKKFEDAEKNAPSIIFIDEIDAIASKREETHGEVEKRVVAQLLAIMDGLKSRGKVVVIAASNIPNMLDPALRRPGRFDREIEIGVPRKEGRLSVLKIHTRSMPLLTKDNLKTLRERNKDFDEKKIVDLDALAEITYGFVGADLASLAKEAAMVVLRRVIGDMNLQSDDPLSEEMLEKLIITQDDFISALKVVRPSALREVLIEKPTTKWGDIGGLENAKTELIEAVEWPLQNKKSFDRLGISPPTGVLLFGPPGTGKTMLAKAVANESKANFILVNGPELMSKWVGESEKAVRKIFEKARQSSPSIIFFDEIDSLVPKRGAYQDTSGVSEKVVNQLLTEMNGLQEMKDVVVIGATNRPDLLDSALLRPGRFDRIVLVGVPDIKSRKEIFDVHLKNMPLSKDVKRDELVQKTEGYVGADIESICREAAMLALRDDMNVKEIKMKYFNEALKKVRPSASKDIEALYEQFENSYRKTRAEEMKDRPNYYG